MGKKTKRQFNVRLREETLFAIQELAGRWECSQGEVIERVISETPIPPRAGGQPVLRGESTGGAHEFTIVPIDEV